MTEDVLVSSRRDELLTAMPSRDTKAVSTARIDTTPALTKEAAVNSGGQQTSVRMVSTTLVDPNYEYPKGLALIVVLLSALVSLFLVALDRLILATVSIFR